MRHSHSDSIKILHGDLPMPHFRWKRIHRILYYDPTALLELMVTMCYCLLQGAFLASGTTEVPWQVTTWLSFGGFTSERFGFSLIVLAVLQLWSVGTAYYRLRGWVSFLIALNAFAVALAYVFAGASDRYVFPFLIGTVIIESFLAARDWQEAKELRHAPDEPPTPNGRLFS